MVPCACSNQLFTSKAVAAFVAAKGTGPNSKAAKAKAKAEAREAKSISGSWTMRDAASVQFHYTWTHVPGSIYFTGIQLRGAGIFKVEDQLQGRIYPGNKIEWRVLNVVCTATMNADKTALTGGKCHEVDSAGKKVKNRHNFSGHKTTVAPEPTVRPAAPAAPKCLSGHVMALHTTVNTAGYEKGCICDGCKIFIHRGPNAGGGGGLFGAAALVPAPNPVSNRCILAVTSV